LCSTGGGGRHPIDSVRGAGAPGRRTSRSRSISWSWRCVQAPGRRVGIVPPSGVRGVGWAVGEDSGEGPSGGTVVPIPPSNGGQGGGSWALKRKAPSSPLGRMPGRWGLLGRRKGREGALHITRAPSGPFLRPRGPQLPGVRQPARSLLFFSPGPHWSPSDERESPSRSS